MPAPMYTLLLLVVQLLVLRGAAVAAFQASVGPTFRSRSASSRIEGRGEGAARCRRGSYLGAVAAPAPSRGSQAEEDKARIQAAIKSTEFNSPKTDLDEELEGVVLPSALSGLERITRAVTFWSNVVPILFRYYMESNKAEGTVTAEDWEATHEWGSEKLSSTIMDLKGFYVKTGQVMSTRVDLFPEQYTSKLQGLQDRVDPIPIEVVKALVSQELLEGEPLSTLFKEFDEKPLGSASIAQVHGAVLLDGRKVAVKVQRPAEEPKLRGDIQNLKAFALRFRESLPVDYFPVFCELERALTNELDFRAEAQSTEKIAASVSHTADGEPAVPPLYVPRPIPGLCSKRVMILEFCEGIGLNRLADKMAEMGVMEASPEAKLLGTKLLTALTEAFGRMIFGSGFLHGDPHPGNIFLSQGGKVALIDCGQVKQLPRSQQLKMATLISTIGKWGQPDGPSVETLGKQVADFGVTTKEGAGEDCLAAAALLLFGPAGCSLPGGYSNQELSQESPLRQLLAFPQELVMMGRATILIKGVASKLDIKWNLGEKWRAEAETCLSCGLDGCSVPVYAAVPAPLGGALRASDGGDMSARPKFKDVRQSLQGVGGLARSWALGKGLEVMPENLKKKLIARAADRIEGIEEEGGEEGGEGGDEAVDKAEGAGG